MKANIVSCKVFAWYIWFVTQNYRHFYVALSCDRVVACYKPIFYRENCTKIRGYQISAVLALMTGLAMMPIPWYRQLTSTGTCVLPTESKPFTSFVQYVYGGAVPVSLLASSAVAIAVFLCKRGGHKTQGGKGNELRLAVAVFAMNLATIATILLT